MVAQHSGRVLVACCLAVLLVTAAPASSRAGDEEAPSGNVQRVDARRLPHCPVQSRAIAIVSTGGPDSMAVLSVPGHEQGRWQKLVRVGDRFAGAKVGHIGRKRVWLQRRNAWCQLTRTL
ncbi:MAG: hypothetical protein ACOC1F_14760, partial [Myxococcota bacterium]